MKTRFPSTGLRLAGWLVLLAGTAADAANPAALAEAAGSSTPSIAPALQAIGLGLASALAVGISVVGASLAMGRIGSAALGAAAEKPELLMRSLLFMALAEGLGVLGFAVAILLLQKIG